MAIETEREEEKKKDDIVQQIYDLMESKDWGNGLARMTIKVVFEGRLNMLPLVVNEVAHGKKDVGCRSFVVELRQ